MENLNTTGRLLAEINSLSPKEIREIFMTMWRDSPHLNDGLTADDCIEFFASALKGSSDFTFELLAQTCADYDVGTINNSFSLLPRQEYDRLKAAAIAVGFSEEEADAFAEMEYMSLEQVNRATQPAQTGERDAGESAE